VTETRRHALKMLGTIGVTCAFPFAGDELYGQHVHTTLAQTPAPGPYAPAFFTPSEFATLSRLTDVIIPPTDTPGAAAAGVPEYIDRVVSLNAEHQPLIRAGLAWLERQAKARFSREVVLLGEAEHIAILQPLSDEVDRQQREAQRARFRTEAQGAAVYYVALTDKDTPARPFDSRAKALAQGTSAAQARVALATDPGLPVRFFRLIKNLTADGYYTSRVGLLEELGYAGNTALARFPGCSVPEH
jgi:glucoside 3-dehydrogenase (cytochrome c) hitch-hiker subunit